MKENTTFDENGKALTVHYEEHNVTYPADYSFATINDYVHNQDTNFEDLVYLCLGMACHIEKISKK